MFGNGTRKPEGDLKGPPPGLGLTVSWVMKASIHPVSLHYPEHIGVLKGCGQGCGVMVAISESDSDSDSDSGLLVSSDSDSGSDAKYDTIIDTVQSLITVFS